MLACSNTRPSFSFISMRNRESKCGNVSLKSGQWWWCHLHNFTTKSSPCQQLCLWMYKMNRITQHHTTSSFTTDGHESGITTVTRGLWHMSKTSVIFVPLKVTDAVFSWEEPSLFKTLWFTKSESRWTGGKLVLWDLVQIKLWSA